MKPSEHRVLGPMIARANEVETALEDRRLKKKKRRKLVEEAWALAEQIGDLLLGRYPGSSSGPGIHGLQ